MEKADRAGAILTLFKTIPYLTYVAILLLVVMIAIWIVFGIKKYRWARTLAITLTVLVVIAGLLLFTPYLVGVMSGKKIPLDYYFGIKDRAVEKEKFRDYRDREKDKEENNQEKEKGDKESGKKSGLDIYIAGSETDLLKGAVII
jgi:Zn-dependent protease with chaperone function